MRRGISPIVSVVMLIALATIAGVSIYFWVGGITTKQPTSNTPIVITSQKYNCTTSTSSVQYNVGAMVQNLDYSDDLTTTLYLIGDNNTCENATEVNIPAQKQALVVFDCTTATAGVTKGTEYPIYSEDSGSASIIC